MGCKTCCSRERRSADSRRRTSGNETCLAHSHRLLVHEPRESGRLVDLSFFFLALAIVSSSSCWRCCCCRSRRWRRWRGGSVGTPRFTRGGCTGRSFITRRRRRRRVEIRHEILFVVRVVRAHVALILDLLHARAFGTPLESVSVPPASSTRKEKVTRRDKGRPLVRRRRRRGDRALARSLFLLVLAQRGGSGLMLGQRLPFLAPRLALALALGRRRILSENIVSGPSLSTRSVARPGSPCPRPLPGRRRCAAISWTRPKPELGGARFSPRRAYLPGKSCGRRRPVTVAESTGRVALARGRNRHSHRLALASAGLCPP